MYLHVQRQKDTTRDGPYLFIRVGFNGSKRENVWCGEVSGELLLLCSLNSAEGRQTSGPLKQNKKEQNSKVDFLLFSACL